MKDIRNAGWTIRSQFSTLELNRGRQIELDVARALAVIFMVLVHVQMTFLHERYADASFGLVIDFLGGIPAAPVFMFLMGIGFAYTRKQEPEAFFKRGLLILLLGYLLNFLRDGLPELIDYAMYGEKEALNYFVEGMIDVDILQFAGVMMMVWAGLKWLRISNKVLALVGLGFALLNLVMLNISVEGYLGQALTGLLWGSCAYSEFPFLSWVVYPLYGYLFGWLLLRSKDKDRFYRILLKLSFPLLVLSFVLFYFGFGQSLGLRSELDYYHHNLFANIVYLLFCVFWISLLYFLVKRIPANLFKPFGRWSKNVTEIYFIHWILLSWMSWFMYPYACGIWMFFSISVIIFAVSDGLAHVYKRMKEKG